EVFYPVGWDDNGLATERRVQNYYGVRCDPSRPYQPGFTPPALGNGRALSPADQQPVSRRNFVELCRQLTELDEVAYAQAWQRLGLSVDWDVSYRTIDERVQAVSQLAFLRNLARGEAYQAEAPALWDVTFRTAVAQAEIEDREIPGTFVRLAFGTERGKPDRPTADPAEVVVATTRPELLPACVALVAHPDDERYAALVGSTATTPLFGVQVPILAHRLADPAKGTGLVMVCTFGDMTDVTWWRDLQLDTRPVIGKDGRLLPAAPPGVISADGIAAYQRIAGQPAKAARQLITDLLHEAGAIRGEPEPVRHAVKFYEYGQAPLEIITTRQWYIRNGSRSKGLADSLLAAGRELQWHPEYMRTRYEHWLEGLTGDWLISRQRYRGVPIPVWYSLDASGRIEEDNPIQPAEADLPVDPAADTPPGYRPDQRGQPGGFAADPDVMDTWATSSLTPQIASGWPVDEDLIGRVFPMDLRPQAHEIIRTWLFYTVLRSHDEAGVLPWRHAAISGWILDPDRKKMSKSKGNAVTPMDLLREHGTDAVRYWATSARLGVDTAFDLAQIKIGRRLAIKILNAGRFVLGFDPAADSTGADIATAATPSAADTAAADIATAATPSAASSISAEPNTYAFTETITESIDRALLRRLAEVVERCTAALDAYDHATALELAERFFWFFCDDYLELVKARAYGERGPTASASAVTTLRTGLSVVLRLLAPFLPFVTEEVWSWWQSGSVHRASWPDPEALRTVAGSSDDAVLSAASAAIAAIRKAKSQARVPMKDPIPLLVLTAGQERLDALAAAGLDVQAAGHVDKIELRPTAGSEPAYDVVL
ncbi:MAG TPA: valine--tRNA ligase, partial [Streptosporangiaceae bacterium]|nr:valine--tRNA ligase [Streptosporangiaceae bacterium]